MFRSREKQVQPQVSGAHACLNVCVRGSVNHVTREHRPNRHATTPNALVIPIKLWYLVSYLLHSLDRLTKKRQRFALAESGEIVLPLL